jgi:hypothetical protein
MAKSVKVGDRVKWNTSQGETTGKVVKTVTGTAKVKGHFARASKAHPGYEVKSAKSGKLAIHKASSLKKARKSSK